MVGVVNRVSARFLAVCAAFALVFAGWTATAAAFCGFYVSGADTSLFNEATMVVLMRDGRRTVLSMENHYDGPVEDFAMVVPVPQVLEEENVKTLPTDVFDRVDAMGAPRLVEYWEQDPCRAPLYDDSLGGVQDSASFGDAMGDADGGGGVVVEAEFTVGEYDIVILSADDSTGLDTWLRENDYTIPEGGEELLRPYVESGMYFFVARVDVEKVAFDEGGDAMLSPLRFYYDSDEFALPIRLGLVNANEAQDLIVNILAPNQRYEVANYANVRIPTNIAVTEAVRENFAEFYVALMDETLEQNPDAVITEYAWNASTCDPCPGVSLTPDDFMTLGADVAPGGSDDHPFQRGYVLTRLHARYGAGDIGDDLVFRAADPIVGGRGIPDAQGNLSQQIEMGPNTYLNNFQGRYAILHPWEGEVACDDPVFGIWGGPLEPEDYENAVPRAAQNTAFADRDAVDLKAVLASSVDDLGLDPDEASENDTENEGEPMVGGAGGPSNCSATGAAGGLEACAWLLFGFLALRRRR